MAPTGQVGLAEWPTIVCNGAKTLSSPGLWVANYRWLSQYGPGALRAAGHVVLLQRRVFAPVHHGVEVEVELLPGGEAVRGHRRAEGGEERGLLAVLEPVGVCGHGGGLGQGLQPGEQRDA